MGQGVEQFDAVTTGVLWKLDEADLGDIGLVDDPNASFIAVAVSGHVATAEILGPAYRASALRHPTETRTHPPVKGENTAAAAPPFTIIAFQRAAETRPNDPPETVSFDEASSLPAAIEKESIDEPLDCMAVKALGFQELARLKSPLRFGF